ncbi:YncE family protein [Streptomyces sp. NRRL F-2664]|uniref:YncE family protein n=1 Tax=Streptomyces sp. NRRL F-2664 TaxID=1463842 RepID=UPI00131A71E3
MSPDGNYVYTANFLISTVSVFSTVTDTVVQEVAVGDDPSSVAVTSDGAAYVANSGVSNSVTVLDTSSFPVTVRTTVPVGAQPKDVAVTPDGSRAYVANFASDSVSVIGTATNTVVGDPIPVDDGPAGVAMAQVPKRVSSTTVVSAPNPSTVGQAVTFTASVAGDSGTPAGTVTFKEPSTAAAPSTSPPAPPPYRRSTRPRCPCPGPPPCPQPRPAPPTAHPPPPAR